MARILRARRSGEPGGVRNQTVEGYTGQRVSSDREGKAGVRRLFARDPRKGAFVNFGTVRDILGFTNHADIPNPTPGSSPRILNGTSVLRGARTRRKGVANRSANTRITKR